MVRKRGFLHRQFFVKEESTLFFRMAKKASKQPIPTQLTFYKRRRVYKRAHVDKISLDEISLKCEASESVQFSTCYDPIHRFQRVKAKSSFFSKIKIHLRKKNTQPFLSY